MAVSVAMSFSAISAGAAEFDDAPCLQRNSTNPEFAECTQSIIGAADAKLKVAWNRLFQFEGGSRTDRGRALLNEQRAWIAFRSKACEEYFQPNSGREGQVIHGPLCIARIINDRASDLTGRYELMSP